MQSRPVSARDPATTLASRWMFRRGSNGRRRALEGLVLALGAPLGWLAGRVLLGASPLVELQERTGLYVYLLLSTLIAFSLFGLILGFKEDRLAERIRLLDRRVVTDPLTGLPNRRLFFDRLAELRDRWMRTQRCFSLAILDLDQFKALNDRLGHPVGDRVLRCFARTLTTRMRGTEFVARIGGEEFGLLFPDSDADEARDAVERILGAIASQVAGDAGVNGRVTASAGVVSASRLPGASDLSRVLAAADAALYRAKAGGRNRVEVGGGNAVRAASG